jgi:hypothetical protein
MIPRVQHFANGSDASPRFVSAVDGTDPQNRLGWPGLWPTLLPYRSFDPTVNPVNTVVESCSTTVDDEPVSLGPVLNLDYECDFNSLHLPNRATQIDATVTPGAAGWAGWEYAQWALDDLQSLHDTAGTRLASVPAGSLSTVGATGNTVVGTAANPSGPAPVAGAYLGVGPIQGFQAEELIDILDNGAELWLSQLTTTDGATLSGFGSVETALQYNYASPLRWFPGAVAVTETSDPSGYPQATGYAISDAGSHLFDLLGLAGAYATAYALTDQGNASVGGAQPVVALFDGDPFPADNQVADGEATLHDRALGMLRVLVVDVDRLHVDPTSGILVDDVSFAGATPTRGQTISTSSVAYAIVALRAVRRALGSQLALYDNTSADTAVSGVTTVLDSASLPLTGAPGGATLISDRIDAMLKAEAQLLLQSLTTSDGHAFVGWNVQSGETVSTDDTLDAHTAAIRGLLSAYEATGDATYLTRAGAVFTRMDSVFFDPAGLVYMSAPVPQSSVAYTPMRFALLEAALREMYEVSGTATGQGALGTLLENRLARSIKLLLNGWDDLDADGLVDDPSECLTATSLPDAGADGGQGTLAHGGLQMAERALSGEIGSVCDSIDPATCVSAGFSVVRHYTADREHDCVPEISAVSLPSALANQVTFTLSP